LDHMMDRMSDRTRTEHRFVARHLRRPLSPIGVMRPEAALLSASQAFLRGDAKDGSADNVRPGAPSLQSSSLSPRQCDAEPTRLRRKSISLERSVDDWAEDVPRRPMPNGPATRLQRTHD